MEVESPENENAYSAGGAHHGASSGVGQCTARLLSQRGDKVFGTSRNPASAERIPGVEMLSLDVRADASVRACVDDVVNRGGGLDVLINNAGYELAGALEELSLEEARAQFETNFLGVVRMVNAVLPLMRRQKGGYIINVSSLAGLSAIPFLRRFLPRGMFEQGVRRSFSLDRSQ
jgi:NAD(P)-dependent dehydrogenase (short-subunit alcohol dehydrogenase family)